MKNNILTKEEIISFLQTHKSELECRFGLTKIALFGSFARNQAHEASDIDFLIETRTKSYDNLFDLQEFLETNLHNKVDLCSLDSIRPFIMRSIQEELIYV